MTDIALFLQDSSSNFLKDSSENFLAIALVEVYKNSPTDPADPNTPASWTTDVGGSSAYTGAMTAGVRLNFTGTGTHADDGDFVQTEDLDFFEWKGKADPTGQEFSWDTDDFDLNIYGTQHYFSRIVGEPNVFTNSGSASVMSFYNGGVLEFYGDNGYNMPNLVFHADTTIEKVVGSPVNPQIIINGSNDASLEIKAGVVVDSTDMRMNLRPYSPTQGNPTFTGGGSGAKLICPEFRFLGRNAVGDTCFPTYAECDCSEVHIWAMQFNGVGAVNFCFKAGRTDIDGFHAEIQEPAGMFDINFAAGAIVNVTDRMRCEGTLTAVKTGQYDFHFGEGTVINCNQFVFSAVTGSSMVCNVNVDKAADVTINCTLDFNGYNANVAPDEFRVWGGPDVPTGVGMTIIAGDDVYMHNGRTYNQTDATWKIVKGVDAPETNRFSCPTLGDRMGHVVWESTLQLDTHTNAMKIISFTRSAGLASAIWNFNNLDCDVSGDVTLNAPTSGTGTIDIDSGKTWTVGGDFTSDAWDLVGAGTWDLVCAGTIDMNNQTITNCDASANPFSVVGKGCTDGGGNTGITFV